MLDVRVRRYVSPLAEQVLDDITPAIEVRNYADEDATITGHVRIYRKSTDSLEYTSELAETELRHGTTATIPALSAWSPGAPADDDYFILADIVATSYLPGPPLAAVLGAFTFDVKPGPMGPAPAGHHTTHENGGMDEVDLTGMTGLLATPQTPILHAADHQNGGADEMSVAGLSGVLADAQTAAAHKASHQNGGADEISVAGLSGELADNQPPKAHGNAAHTSTFEDQANKGAAGGYCPLPNPLDSTLPLRADGTPNRPTGLFIETDHCTAVSSFWTTTTISSGLIATTAGTPNHPGIARISARAAAGGDSGCFFTLNAQFLRIAGNEQTDTILMPGVLAGSTIRIGFLDNNTSADATDGCYIEMAQVAGVDGTIVGKTAAGGVRSTTATSFLLVTNTWYRLRIRVNAAANLITFTCFSEAGAVLWTDTLNANIPTAAGQETGQGIVATNTAGLATIICYLDYTSLWIARALVR
jgi:hypothetical protein